MTDMNPVDGNHTLLEGNNALLETSRETTPSNHDPQVDIATKPVATKPVATKPGIAA